MCYNTQQEKTNSTYRVEFSLIYNGTKSQYPIEDHSSNVKKNNYN